MSLILHQPGLHSLLVDGGRPGSRSLGVPVGGAADRAAWMLGNALVGNFAEETALEITLVGPLLEATQPIACVIFGAPFECTVNSQAVSAGKTFGLSPGDLLRIGGTRINLRACLCVAGGFASAEILGGKSGLEAVKKGQALACRAARTEARALPFCTGFPQSAQGEPSVIRVLIGPQRDWFEDDLFFKQDYEITTTSNRMGLRLRGQPLRRRAGEMVSEAVAPGAIQVANDGLPIVLGVDGQTIGGYPKVAHVIRADLDRLAQLRPGQKVRFLCVSEEEARAAAIARNEFLKTWICRLRCADRAPLFLRE